MWTEMAGRLVSAAMNRDQKDTFHQLIVLAALCLLNGIWAATKGDLDYNVNFCFTHRTDAFFF